MTKILTLFAFLCFSLGIFAQGTIAGKVLDMDTKDPLISALVQIEGTTKGAITNYDGDFIIENVDAGDYVLIISYVSFEDKKVNVSVKDGQSADIGTQELVTSAIGLQSVNIVASTAIDRKTPVAVSTISAEEIENKLGNQEFPEILKSTPSIYTYNNGGGAGDAQLAIRGFSQENFAVLINGISVSGMEDNKVYWSNWAGLGDVTRTIQVQRGLGASRLAITSVGGTVNIITKTTDQRKGGSAFTTIGNDGYKKTGLTLSTGRTENGWAATFSGSRTEGDGYIEGNYIDAWSYFGSIAKEIGDDQQLLFTVFGAPQKHGQRSFWQSVGTQRNELGTKWSDDYGSYKGEDFTFRENFYHKPQAALNHFWDISEKTQLNTSVYGSTGRGGGTGDLGGFIREDGAYRSNEFRQPKDAYGNQQFDQYYLYNTGQSNSLYDTTMFAVDFAMAGDTSSAQIAAAGKNGLIKRASMNEHQWWGILSTLTQNLSDNLTLNAGLDLRFYTGSHYRKPIDLLGADYWFDDDNVNEQSHWVDFNNDGIADDGEMGNLTSPSNDAGSLFGSVEENERIDYYNDENINWYGAFAQLEYSKGQLSAFLSGAVNSTQMRRIDFFNKTPNENTTDWLNFLGGNVKLGANYNLDENNNIFVNAGYISRAPYFDALFPTFNNDEQNTDAVNEGVTSFELGYGYRSSAFSANINGYMTNWTDKTEVDDFIDANNEPFIFNLLGVDAVHTGIEVDFAFKADDNLTFNGFASFGDWKWNNDPEGVISDQNNNVVDEIDVFIKDLKVGGSAQKTFGLGMDWDMGSGVSIDANWHGFDDLYGQYSPLDRDETDLIGVQALRLPFYSLVDAGLIWKFEIAGMDAQARVNVNNLFDEEYISAAADNPDAAIGDDRESAAYDALVDGTLGWFGFGRTWNTGLKVFF